MQRKIALRLVFAVLIALSIAVPSAAAGRGGKGSCTVSAPGVSVDNNWSWTGQGSWGMPGQQLAYAISVRNYDTGAPHRASS
jgi:hypothetical protein